MTEARLPKPEIRGEGTVTYRCASCRETVERPVIKDGKPYHPEHIGDQRSSRS